MCFLGGYCLPALLLHRPHLCLTWKGLLGKHVPAAQGFQMSSCVQGGGFLLRPSLQSVPRASNLQRVHYTCQSLCRPHLNPDIISITNLPPL